MKKQLFLLSLAALSCGSVLAMSRKDLLAKIIEKGLKDKVQVLYFPSRERAEREPNQGFVCVSEITPTNGGYEVKYIPKEYLYQLCPIPKRSVPLPGKEKKEGDTVEPSAPEYSEVSNGQEELELPLRDKDELAKFKRRFEEIEKSMKKSQEKVKIIELTPPRSSKPVPTSKLFSVGSSEIQKEYYIDGGASSVTTQPIDHLTQFCRKPEAHMPDYVVKSVDDDASKVEYPEVPKFKDQHEPKKEDRYVIAACAERSIHQGKLSGLLKKVDLDRPLNENPSSAWVTKEKCDLGLHDISVDDMMLSLFWKQ